MDDSQRARMRMISSRSSAIAMSYVARPEHVEISVDDFEEKEEAVEEEKAEETCSICLDGGVDRALSCGHAFHDACLAGLVRSRVDEARVRDIRCPGTADAPACDVALRDDEVRALLDAEGRDKYARFLLAEDPAAVECPSCGAAAAAKASSPAPVCFLDFVRSTARRIRRMPRPAGASRGGTAARSGGRAEPSRASRSRARLRAPVCKISGCNVMWPVCKSNLQPDFDHMTCSCGTNFCWLCGDAIVLDGPEIEHFRGARGLQLAARRDGSLVARGVHEFAASRFIMIYLLLRVAGHIKTPVTLDIIVVVLAFATTPCLIANARVLGSSSSEVTTWACIPCLLFHIVAELPEAWSPMVWIRSLERRERWFLEVTPRRDGRRRGGQWRPRRVPASPRRVPASPTADVALPDLLPVSRRRPPPSRAPATSRRRR
ncbi:hypothetical protein JL722_10765 [Aureococcus anophagefferens]|nr:hypothetical protein JL722_10765 [Aureococcus anophagefferens]